jgi:hypothetical protein
LARCAEGRPACYAEGRLACWTATGLERLIIEANLVEAAARECAHVLMHLPLRAPTRSVWCDFGFTLQTDRVLPGVRQGLPCSRTCSREISEAHQTLVLTAHSNLTRT